MRWEEAVGFTAVGLNIIGNWMLTKKNARGWVVRLVCNAAQLAYAVLIWSPSLMFNAVIFGGINVVGIVRWRKAIE